MPVVGNASERYVAVPGGHLYSRTRGAGPDVLLLHAGAVAHPPWPRPPGWSAEAALARYQAPD
jgi:hypothetical protein